MRSSLGILILLASVQLCLAAEPESKNPFQSDVLVERVFWPVIMENRLVARAGCDGMRPEDIVLREDGERVKVTHVERKSLPSVHAILIDNSGSMKSRLDNAIRAALEYARATVPAEPVMVATFDDTLVLRSAPTTDLAQLERAIRGIELGHKTAMWSSLYQLARYLEARRERKVIVLLGDGLDSHFNRRYSFERVAWFLGSIPDATVFPIGLQIPNERGFTSALARPELTQLAQATGGRFFMPERRKQVGECFSAIRSELNREQFVTYIPRPFGEGKRDLRDERPYRLRKVTVTASARAKCDVESAGRTVRFSGKRFEAPDFLNLEPAAENDGARLSRLRASGLPLPSTAKVTRRGSLPSHWQPLDVAPKPSSLQMLDSPRWITGTIEDIVRESGELYALDPRAGWATTVSPDSERVLRDIAVEIPTAEEMRRAPRAPLDLFQSLVEQIASHPDPNVKPATLINGQTFFDLRTYLAQALFLHRDDLRTWTVEQIRREILADFDSLSRDLRASGLSESEIGRLHEALVLRSESPGPAQPQRFVAEWLADHQIGQLVPALEHRLATDLARSTARSAIPFERLWHTVWTRFAMARRDRVLAWLRLAYDPQRDRFGFHRFVLPATRSDQPGVRPVWRHPAGWLTVRWALNSGLIEPGVWTPEPAEYVRPTGAETASIAALAANAGLIDETIVNPLNMTRARVTFTSDAGQVIKVDVGYFSSATDDALPEKPLCARVEVRSGTLPEALEQIDRDYPACPIEDL